MARNDPHFRLRLPQKLKEIIELEAEKNARSINAEIVHRLHASIDADLKQGRMEMLQEHAIITSFVNAKIAQRETETDEYKRGEISGTILTYQDQLEMIERALLEFDVLIRDSE